MSRSGIPIVQQAAETVNNIAGSIGSIFSGGNVFEGLGRLTVAPIAGTISAGSSVTGGILEKAPIVGDLAQGSRRLSENITSKDAALQAGRGALKTGATVAGATIGGPLIASQLGIGSGLATGLGGVVGSQLGSGNFKGALSSLAGVAAPALEGVVPKELSGLIPGLPGTLFGGGATSGLPSAVTRVEQPQSVINSPAQVYSNSSNTAAYIALAGIGILIFFLLKKRKVI